VVLVERYRQSSNCRHWSPHAARTQFATKLTAAFICGSPREAGNTLARGQWAEKGEPSAQRSLPRIVPDAPGARSFLVHSLGDVLGKAKDHMKLRMIAAIAAAVLGLTLVAAPAQADSRDYRHDGYRYSRGHDCDDHRHYGHRQGHRQYAHRGRWQDDRYGHRGRGRDWRRHDRRWDDRDDRRGRGRHGRRHDRDHDRYDGHRR
jgi:hypothetical protein